MKYYLDDAGVIYAYDEDGSQNELIGNKKEISVNEVQLILKPPFSQAQLTELAGTQKIQLRAVADAEIAWRQDAVDYEIATTDEAAALLAWKKYRVLLMRVDTSAPDWPTPPERQAR